MLASSSAGGHVFRTLREEDIPGVKALCLDCFPVEYSDKWFMYVTSSKVSWLELSFASLSLSLLIKGVFFRMFLTR